jgi:phage repressor protein C with HTH and peptisase S24 domain
MVDESEKFLAGLRSIMEVRGLKDAPLSEAAGLHQSFVRDLKRGKAASPKLSSAVRIAQALDMTVEEVMSWADGRPEDRPTIAIAGKVGAGAQVPVFDAYPKGGGPQVECPSGLSPHGVVAVEVEGDSMEPVYSDGDILFYSRNGHDSVPSDIIGHRCVCEDENGMGWVKQVKAGDEPGLFHLISLNPGANNIWNMRLKWAARVLLHWPADLAKKIEN